jgi:hypothetical protein
MSELLKLDPTPVRIQLRRKKGWRLQEFSRDLNGLTAVSCTRGKGRIYGNPFKVGVDGTAFEVCDKHVNWLLTTKEGLEVLRRCKTELRGRNLACSCPLSQPHCHVNTLLKYANE